LGFGFCKVVFGFGYMVSSFGNTAIGFGNMVLWSRHFRFGHGIVVFALGNMDFGYDFDSGICTRNTHIGIITYSPSPNIKHPYEFFLKNWVVRSNSVNA
jgi:hypothetical protein